VKIYGGRVLKLEVQESPLVTILRCSGRMVYGDGADTLVKAVSSKDTRFFLLDLSGVSAIDAAGLGALAAVGCWARNENRRIYLANLSARIREALKITGLTAALDIFPMPENGEARNGANNAPAEYCPRTGSSSIALTTGQ
jgi:anti-anti-sigma factor